MNGTEKNIILLLDNTVLRIPWMLVGHWGCLLFQPHGFKMEALPITHAYVNILQETELKNQACCCHGIYSVTQI